MVLTREKTSSIAVLVHLYYEDGFDIIKNELLNLSNLDVRFFFNISADNIKYENNCNEIKKVFPQAIITISPNKGKDIGGKLTLLYLCIQLNMSFDFYIFIHDKKSLHTSLGDIWRTRLLRIISKTNAGIILQHFKENRETGIVSSKEFIVNEYNSTKKSFDTKNNSNLKRLIENYNLKPRGYEFVGGTMYWVRAEIYNSFFKKHSPLKIRSTFERGNVLDNDHGTVTHAWERILSWIASDKGYKIKGI